MRYFGVVNKEVDPGGEHLIGRARTLLGMVEQRIANSVLTQLVHREISIDGFEITVGNINGNRFVRIIGGLEEEKEPEGPAFVVLLCTSQDPLLGLPLTYDILFLFPFEDKMYKLFELDEDEYLFQSRPAGWNLFSAGIYWYDSTITIETLMNTGISFQQNQGRFRFSDNEWALINQDLPIQIQESDDAPATPASAGEFVRIPPNNTIQVFAEEDELTVFEESATREAFYSWLQWTGPTYEEFYISMRSETEEPLYLHRKLGDSGDSFDWKRPSSDDLPSINVNEVLIYTKSDSGYLRTHQLRRYEMRLVDDDGAPIEEPRPLTLEKEWDGYWYADASNPAGTSENFEAFLDDDTGKVVGYCNFHLWNRFAGDPPAKLSFYTAPGEDIVDADGNVLLAGGIANATLAFEFDAYSFTVTEPDPDTGELADLLIEYDPTIREDSIGIDDHGMWYRLQGGFEFDEDTGEWVDRSVYIIVIQSIRGLGDFPEWIFRRNRDGTLTRVYETYHVRDPLTGYSEGIKSPRKALNWLCFVWVDKSNAPTSIEPYYIDVTSTWDRTAEENTTLKKFLDAEVVPLPGELEFDPTVRYGPPHKRASYDRVYELTPSDVKKLIPKG